jgi:hypothetical protein
MARLFNTFDDVKPFISGNANNEMPTIEPYMDDAVRDYLAPFLSKAEYDLLVIAYNANTCTAAQLAILPKAQSVIANFAYYYFADSNNFMISDAGNLRAEHSEGKSAYQWQVRDFKDRCWLNGWAAVEDLIKYLYTNKANYTNWAGSAERTSFNRMFVWNTDIFKSYYRINSYGTLYSLHPSIKDIETTYVSEHITASLYKDLLDRLIAKTSTADDIELLPYLERMLVYGALVSVVKNSGYEFGINGLQAVTREATTQNSSKMADVAKTTRDKMHDDFSREFLKSRNRLINFLNENASSSKYISYYNKFINIAATDATDSNTDKGIVFFG